MNKEFKYFFIVLPFCLAVFFATMSFKGSSCPHCGFSNSEEDRYCLDCTKEIRQMTSEEIRNLVLEEKKLKSNISAGQALFVDNGSIQRFNFVYKLRKPEFEKQVMKSH